MQTGCSPCTLCSLAVSRPGEDPGADPSAPGRPSYLLTRGAARRGRLADVLRRWRVTCRGACPGTCPCGRRRVATTITPATTTTTITPTTPPAEAPAEAPDVATPSASGEDRAFLDFEAAERPPASRWCAGRCGGCAGSMSALRDLEGRCCAVLAIVSFMGMVVGLALFSDPLLLSMSTRLQRAHCVTVNFTLLFGASNCSWASCRESCTSQAYKCVQIFVNYTLQEVTPSHRPPVLLKSIPQNGMESSWNFKEQR